MTRARKAFVTATVVALVSVAGVAVAVPRLRLNGRGQGTSIAPVQWATGTPATSNDAGTQNDPGGASPFQPSATREAYNLGSTPNPTFVGSGAAAVLTITSTDVYDGYKYAISATHSDNRAGWVIQAATVVDDSATVAGSIPLPPNALSVGLDPNACNKPLNSPSKGIEFALRWGPGVDTVPQGTFAYKVLIEAVPTGAYVSGSCASWSGLI